MSHQLNPARRLLCRDIQALCGATNLNRLALERRWHKGREAEGFEVDNGRMRRQEALSPHTVITPAIPVQRKPLASPTHTAACHHCVWLLGKPSTSLPALHSVCSHRNSSCLDSLQLSRERKGKLFSSSREKGVKRKNKEKEKARNHFLWHTMTHRFGNEGCESFLFSLFFSGLTADKSHSSETSDRTG